MVWKRLTPGQQDYFGGSPSDKVWDPTQAKKKVSKGYWAKEYQKQLYGKGHLAKGGSLNPIKARMDTLKPKQILGLRKLLRKELFTTLSTKDIKPGKYLGDTSKKASTLNWAQKKFGTGGSEMFDRFKRKTLAKKNTKWLNIKTRGAGVLSGAVDIARGTKQVLPTVGRTIAGGLGWGAVITGVSLLSKTKRAKKYRADLQGTRPQNIKHFPAQRIKTKDPASVRRLLPRLGRN